MVVFWPLSKYGMSILMETNWVIKEHLLTVIQHLQKGVIIKSKQKKRHALALYCHIWDTQYIFQGFFADKSRASNEVGLFQSSKFVIT